jgi:hypothetical protein
MLARIAAQPALLEQSAALLRIAGSLGTSTSSRAYHKNVVEHYEKPRNVGR